MTSCAGSITCRSKYLIKAIFLLFLNLPRYGVVLRELQASGKARDMFLKSVNLAPLLWASWRELARLCENRSMVG